MGAVAGGLANVRPTVRCWELATSPGVTFAPRPVPAKCPVVVLTARALGGYSGPVRRPGWSLALQSVADCLQFGVSGVVEG